MANSDRKQSGIASMAGRSFGRWAVLRPVKDRVGGETRWLCRCACGNQRTISGRGLRSGESRSCGRCVQREKLAFHVFGRWKVMRRIPSGRIGGARWLCRCSCGTERAIDAKYLRGGHTKSCGCLRREQPSRQFQDLRGQRYGWWSVLKRAPARGQGKQVRWWCRSVCGTFRDVLASNLRRGFSKSCGRCQERLPWISKGDRAKKPSGDGGAAA
jgi:hypothetical protein